MPGQALQVSLAASATAATCNSSHKGSSTELQAGGPGQGAGCSNDDLDRVALQPSVWLAARYQVRVPQNRDEVL